MSTFRSLAAARRTTPLVSIQVAQRAGFQSIAARYAGKETKLHTDAEGRAQDVEKEKQDMLKEQREGKGQWKEGLASDSESAVKADRNEAKTTEETIKELQHEGKKVSGKS